MDKSIRAFIAVTLSESVKQPTKKIIADFKSLNLDIKWVEPHNAHLTLKFLGDVKMNRMDNITAALQEALSTMKPIKTQLFCLGTFPNNRTPHIFWIGLDDSEKKLSQLAETLEEKLKQIGFVRENRDFKSHVTLGRIKSLKNISLLYQKIQDYPLPQTSLTVDKITLFKSTLTRTGPIYEAIEEFLINLDRGTWKASAGFPNTTKRA